MTLARANSTREASERWRLRIKNPDYVPPRYEPKPNKQVGSKKLVCGRWVTVTEEDPHVAK